MKRWKTRQILIGNVGVGGDNPIRIQSMTTCSTRNIEATIGQIIQLADVGCEIARVTVQGMKEADACEGIKNGLLQKGYSIPLVADIHFFPPAAMRVVDFADKVRINPGNYVDKRASFETLAYDEHSYNLEIEKIEEKFAPLVEKCKRLKKSMRIGTNHGSLSDRIMNRYGDTPKGMVEAAFEFARVCRKYEYHDFVFSMKSSNPQVMIAAYRLLVAEMMILGWDYPLHLGVTEAGEGEDGRIKSAMGIGSLLLDGIGDTIRISLTEEAWKEIDPCKRLIAFAQTYRKTYMLPLQEQYCPTEAIDKRAVTLPTNITLHRDGTVLVSLTSQEMENPDFYKNLGFGIQNDLLKAKHNTVDALVLADRPHTFSAKQAIQTLMDRGVSVFSSEPEGREIALLSLQKASTHLTLAHKDPFAVLIKDEMVSEWDLLEKIKPAVIFLSPSSSRVHYCRQFFAWVKNKGIQTPIILNFSYTSAKEDLIIQAATECGALLCDGLGDGLLIEAPYEIDFLRSLGFNILQAARKRTFKTDFISCPSCGRTLFDLQETSRKIREKTAHLPGVKIAIMGCIVNGPGEMADADFGYVGSKTDKIDLYLGKVCVEKDIHFSEAVDRLIDLIKKHGRWIEPEPIMISNS